MDDSIFAATDAAIKAAGTRKPEEIIEYFGFTLIKLYSTILGYAKRYSTCTMVGVNTRLSDEEKAQIGWHELGHVFREHIKDPTFSLMHTDRALFNLPVDSKQISRQEKEANLISAEYCVDTDATLKAIGYYNQSLRDYRALCAQQQELVYACDQLRFSVSLDNRSAATIARLKEYQRTLRSLNEQRLDMESSLMYDNCCKTISEMAAEVNTTEVIFKYKLEALRLRGYDIDRMELESYDKVFTRIG